MAYIIINYIDQGIAIWSQFLIFTIPYMPLCQTDFFLTLREVLANSGRTFYHRGHYEDCLDNSSMKYSLVQFGTGDVDAGVFIGLCLPKQCSDQLVTRALDATFKFMGLPFNVYSIDSATQNYTFPMDWLSFLTAFILIAITMVVFVATVKGCDKQDKKKNKWLAAFDFTRNVRQHFKIRKNEDLNAWDGVRSLSMMWVIIGHSYSFFLGSGVINITNFSEPASKLLFIFIETGLLSVDVFFCLGGFFLAFVMLRNKITLKICGLGILQRALRIWPAYILAMMFYYSLFMRLGSGMLWPRTYQGVETCSTMWRQILFVSNLIENGQRACLGWGWYLQVDFQLFVISVFLLYLYTIRKRLFMMITCLMSILSLLFNFIYTYKKEIRVMTSLQDFANFGDFMLDLYMKPYGRCVPYFMGLALGILYMEYRKQSKSKNEGRQTLLMKLRYYFQTHDKVRVFFEWVGIALMAFVVFIIRPLQLGQKWPQEVHSLYWTFSKPVFLIGMIFTLLPSSLGIRHSFFNLILNAKIFVFIARISFCTYLVHLMFIYIQIYTRTFDIYYNLVDMFVTYAGLLPIILFFGFIMTMTIELPFGTLLKMAMTNLQTKNAQKSPIKNESLVTTQSIKQDLIINKDQTN